MPRTPIEDFIPHYEPVDLDGIEAALADLNPVSVNPLVLAVPLPYTRRADGTTDEIQIGARRDTDWMIYTARRYGSGRTNITATVAQCPGHMVILVARALYAHMSAAGALGRQDTIASDILFALGLSRGEGVPQV